MEVAVLVLLFTFLLREGIPHITDLILSQKPLTWEASINYCEENNGSLIQLDSQEKWNTFTEHDDYKTNNMDKMVYWTSLKFDDTVQCESTKANTPWVYDGWARWLNMYSEPNGCPQQRCVKLTKNWMRTTQCINKITAICKIESVEPTLSTATKAAKTNLVMAPTTEAADEKPDILSTTSNELEADMLSTVSTTPMEVGNVAKSAVSSTTSNSPKSDSQSTGHTSGRMEATTHVELSSGPNTIPTIGTADVTSLYLSNANTISTTAILPSSAIKNAPCSQCCVKEYKTQLDQNKREEIQHVLKVQLAVNKTNLSSQKRKLISVYDFRPSSVAMGGLACGILAAVVGVIVVPDMITLGRFLFKRPLKAFP